ncbi:hypothetical protein Bca101_036833 [Brassica carinata]
MLANLRVRAAPKNSYYRLDGSDPRESDGELLVLEWESRASKSRVILLKIGPGPLPGLVKSVPSSKKRNRKLALPSWLLPLVKQASLLAFWSVIKAISLRLVRLWVGLGPCAVNPLRVVVRRRKVVPAKLSGRVVVLSWVPRRTSTCLLGSCMDMQEGVLLGNGYKGEIKRKLYPTRDGRKLVSYRGTTDLQVSLTTEFSERRQIFLWIASFASFAVKVPMVPVHIWLPEAHVEAPTAGSVILAGIPLKFGTHGAIAIIYTSLTTSRQMDLKKIIAYSSVAHMNLVTIGMFSRAAAVSMSQQKLDSRRQQNTAVCSLQSLSAPGREWGGRSLDGNSSTGSTKSEWNLSVGFPNSFGALTPRLSIKEAESKRKLTRKLEELPFIHFAGAAQHIAGSQRVHTTCLTLRSEGPQIGKHPIYPKDKGRGLCICMTPAEEPLSRSQSPIGHATTPQNESSCGTFSFWRNSGGT